MIDQIFIAMLAVIAAVVAVGLAAHGNMWAWILAYWITLTIKNIINYYTAGRHKHDKEA